MNIDPNEDAALQSLLSEMEADGLRSSEGDFEVEFLPTGISDFDHSTGGGIPRSRVSIFQGEEHSGKTLLLLALIANVQKAGGRCAFIDAEQALTPDFARLLGVDFDKLIVDRPKTLDAAYDLTRKYARSGLFDVVGFDSVSALPTSGDLDAAAADSAKRASVALMHSKELPKLLATLHKRTAVVFINQVRYNPNPPSWWKGGPILYATGGKALRHVSSLTVAVKAGKFYKVGDVRTGLQIKTHTEKNKVSTPYKSSEFDLMFDKGIDMLSNLINTGLRLQIIKQTSSWFYVDIVDLHTGEALQEFKFNGRLALEEALRHNDDLNKSVAEQIELASENTDG